MEIIDKYPKWDSPMSKNCRDLTGQRFGKLEVLYRYYENKNGSAQWVCKCDCGNIKVVLGVSLTRTNRATRSCGCQTYANASKANVKDLTGQRFGKLTVLYDTKQRKNHRVVWHCKCDCGREVDRVSDSLIQKDTISCGLCNASIGVIKIEELLQQNNIEYIREYSFSDLIGRNKMPYRFDFYLPTLNRLIEFDGIQHFQERSIFKDDLETIRYRDNEKNAYCLRNNIPLVRIPYWKVDTLTLKDLLERKYEVE